MMTADQIYRTLARGGTYSLPYLVHFHHDEVGDLYLVNNTEDVEYDGHVYKAGNFTYSRPKNSGGVLTGGELSVTAIGNSLIEFVQLGDFLMTVDVTGILAENGEVSPIGCWHHQYGTVTITNGMQITCSFSNDDRLEMNFPPYMFDQDNNRGNS